MIEIYAHRGLHRDVRENTLEAFGAAVQMRVDGVELDVRRTRDGVLVVNHDPAVEGVVISRALHAALPAYVATLEGALAVLDGVKVNVEIKNIQDPTEPSYDSSGEFEGEVLALLRGLGWTDRVIISCFDEATCARVRDLDATIEVGWLLWGVDLSSALVRARALGLSAVHPHFSTLSQGAMDQARELGLDVNVWTVNDPDQIARVGALGVASIITDDPELVRTVLAGGF
jgi:glycerophosphoryl diester phosphodiesterase